MLALCDPDVRFGSKADMCAAPAHVRFTPNSDRESGHQQPVMSALPPKADMCSARAYVRYGPIADIALVVRHNERDRQPCLQRPQRTHIQLV